MNKARVIFAGFSALILTSGSVFAADEGNGGNGSGDSEIYSGAYNDHQIIPNTMATLCKTSAEDMVNDPTKMKDCIDKLAIKRRSSDAETSREGLKDLNIIKADQLQEMISLAAAKGAAVSDYYSKTAEETAEANANAKTVNDVDGAAVNTNALSTSMINSLSDLYVEQLKYLAISNIENIDKDTLETVALTQNLENAAATGSGESSNKTDASSNNESGDVVSEAAVNTATVVEKDPAKAWYWKGDGVCELCVQKEGSETECREELCPDGTYPDKDNVNVNYVCEKGICEKVDLAE